MNQSVEVQEANDLFPTDDPAPARVLGQALADLLDLQFRVRQARWTTKAGEVGVRNELAYGGAVIDELLDAAANQLRRVGLMPEFSLSQVSRRSRLGGQFGVDGPFASSQLPSAMEFCAEIAAEELKPFELRAPDTSRVLLRIVNALRALAARLRPAPIALTIEWPAKLVAWRPEVTMIQLEQVPCRILHLPDLG